MVWYPHLVPTRNVHIRARRPSLPIFKEIYLSLQILAIKLVLQIKGVVFTANYDRSALMQARLAICHYSALNVVIASCKLELLVEAFR